MEKKVIIKLKLNTGFEKEEQVAFEHEVRDVHEIAYLELDSQEVKRKRFYLQKVEKITIAYYQEVL